MNSRLNNSVSNSAVLARPSRSWLASAAALLVLGGAALSVRAETDREYCERQQGFARDVCLRDLLRDDFLISWQLSRCADEFRKLAGLRSDLGQP